MCYPCRLSPSRLFSCRRTPLTIHLEFYRDISYHRLPTDSIKLAGNSAWNIIDKGKNDISWFYLVIFPSLLNLSNWTRQDALRGHLKGGTAFENFHGCFWWDLAAISLCYCSWIKRPFEKVNGLVVYTRAKSEGVRWLSDQPEKCMNRERARCTYDAMNNLDIFI